MLSVLPISVTLVIFLESQLLFRVGNVRVRNHRVVKITVSVSVLGYLVARNVNALIVIMANLIIMMEEISNLE